MDLLKCELVKFTEMKQDLKSLIESFSNEQKKQLESHTAFEADDEILGSHDFVLKYVSQPIVKELLKNENIRYIYVIVKIYHNTSGRTRYCIMQYYIKTYAEPIVLLDPPVEYLTPNLKWSYRGKTYDSTLKIEDFDIRPIFTIVYDINKEQDISWLIDKLEEYGKIHDKIGKFKDVKYHLKKQKPETFDEAINYCGDFIHIFNSKNQRFSV